MLYPRITDIQDLDLIETEVVEDVLNKLKAIERVCKSIANTCHENHTALENLVNNHVVFSLSREDMDILKEDLELAKTIRILKKYESMSKTKTVMREIELYREKLDRLIKKERNGCL